MKEIDHMQFNHIAQNAPFVGNKQDCENAMSITDILLLCDKIRLYIQTGAEVVLRMHWIEYLNHCNGIENNICTVDTVSVPDLSSWVTEILVQNKNTQQPIRITFFAKYG